MRVACARAHRAHRLRHERLVCVLVGFVLHRGKSNTADTMMVQVDFPVFNVSSLLTTSLDVYACNLFFVENEVLVDAWNAFPIRELLCASKVTYWCFLLRSRCAGVLPCQLVGITCARCISLV